MKKEKSYQIFFVASTIFILLGFGMGYLIFSESPEPERQDDLIEESQEEEHVEGLLEGKIAEIDFENFKVILTVDRPNELSGEDLDISLTERTNFEELILEVYDLNDVRPVSREQVSGEEISAGDDVLINVGVEVVEAVEEERELTARNITLITADEVF